MKKAFFDSTTHVLKCVGYVDSNDDSDIAVDVPDSFSEKPGAVKLAQDGVTLEQVLPLAPIDRSDLDNMEKSIKVAILLTRKWCNEILAGTYTQKTVAQTKAEAKAIWDALQ